MLKVLCKWSARSAVGLKSPKMKVLGRFDGVSDSSSVHTGMFFLMGGKPIKTYTRIVPGPKSVPETVRNVSKLSHSYAEAEFNGEFIFDSFRMFQKRYAFKNPSNTIPTGRVNLQCNV